MGRNSETTQSSGVQRWHLLAQTLELVCIYVLCLVPTQSLWGVWLQMGRNSDATQSSGVQRRPLLAQTLELVCIYVLCLMPTQSLWGVWLQMVRNSESGVQRRHLFAQTLELMLCNISVDIHIHYSTSRQINSKYSENTRERNHRASWSFSSTNELMEVGMWLHSCKIWSDVDFELASAFCGFSCSYLMHKKIVTCYGKPYTVLP
jgi:hypothetical protein